TRSTRDWSSDVCSSDLRDALDGQSGDCGPWPPVIASGLQSSTKGRSAMPTVIAYHDVKDKDHWLSSNTREEFFGPLGVTNIRTFVDPTNPTRGGLLMDVPDLDAVAAALQTPAGAEAEARDGVVSETIVIL